MANDGVGVSTPTMEYIGLGTVAFVASFVVLGAVWKMWVCPSTGSYPKRLAILEMAQLLLGGVAATCAVIQSTREVGRRNTFITSVIGKYLENTHWV